MSAEHPADAEKIVTIRKLVVKEVEFFTTSFA